MSIYSISDLHLSFRKPKPMDIFGNNWEGHEEKIKNNWEKTVKAEDTVIIPGDFSWETYLEGTKQDFEYLNQLPGKKILLKGNHDYWWSSIASMRKYLEENQFKNIDFLHNNSYLIEEHIIAGTRGWALTESETAQKLIKREIIRLELSIQEGIKKYGEDKKIIICMHYPPITKQLLSMHMKIGFIELMKKYKVKKCIYGHLHGKSHQDAVEGNIQGIELQLVSGDYTNFELCPVGDVS